MKRESGLSMFDLILSIGIFAMLLVVISTLMITVFKTSSMSQNRSTIDQNSLNVLHTFATEVRTAQTPYDGSFPLAMTTDSTLSFFGDINGDGVIEKIHYWISGGTFNRGVISPSGQPLTYDTANEKVSVLIKNIAVQPPYFTYYNSSYDGASDTPSLIQPVSPSDVRLVKLSLNINTAIQNQPPRVLETSASIRSLKNK